ncbi:hypothetical protein RHMOL_Rhmol05G0092200 [Rhododendron molle]|uniref:Uncharacterized protein n=1 Tax=Rhododendron molle TaxID=49168 RepID=A0ACC0NP43_RHOML|nr:hypothetical protein RHMOL_Rhmol05G0092200 [Rhododendron molle]
MGHVLHSQGLILGMVDFQEIFLHHNGYKEVIATWSGHMTSIKGVTINIKGVLHEQGIIEPTFTALSKGLVMHSSQQRSETGYYTNPCPFRLRHDLNMPVSPTYSTFPSCRARYAFGGNTRH